MYIYVYFTDVLPCQNKQFCLSVCLSGQFQHTFTMNNHTLYSIHDMVIACIHAKANLLSCYLQEEQLRHDIVRKNDLLQKFLMDQEDMFLEADNKSEEEGKRLVQ